VIAEALEIDGVFLLREAPHRDDRGSFARVFDDATVRGLGLDPKVQQVSLSTNDRRGTLRGLHLQTEPHGQVKIVRCVRGRALDVIVDLRSGSKTLHRWLAIEVGPQDDFSLCVPPGVAQGFYTLEDDTWLLYLLSVGFVPEAEAGVRWDDPTLAIDWPGEPTVISERDANLPYVR
jgi:dTDP-4-dehydrorhamnose 3,5-epimerase